MLIILGKQQTVTVSVIHGLCAMTKHQSSNALLAQARSPMMNHLTSFTHQAVNPRIALGPVCVQLVVAATARRTERLGALLPARIIVLASWPSPNSTWFKSMLAKTGFDLPLTAVILGTLLAEAPGFKSMLAKTGFDCAFDCSHFIGQSVLKHILYQSKSSSNTQ